MFIKHFLSVRHCSECWEYNREQGRQNPRPGGFCILTVEEIDVWSMKETRQGKADRDRVGHAVLYGVVMEGLSEELTRGQRHAGGEGVSYANIRGGGNSMCKGPEVLASLVNVENSVCPRVSKQGPW